MRTTSIFPAALAAALALDAGAALKVTQIGYVTRSSSTVAEQASGITWAGGDLYYVIDDTDKCIHPITITIDGATGKITGNTIGAGVVASGVDDGEGCAYDPAAGTVWVSDETNAIIREFDPATGEALRTAPVPAILKQYYGNRSLEALTISGDGKTMWTCNEEALQCDGEKSTKTTGTTVRLTRFVRESVYGEWVADGQWAYYAEKIGTDPWGSHGRSGVSALVALPDGTLLVLERTLWGDNGWDATFYNRIYAVDFTGATEISGIASLKTETYTAVKKTALFNKEVGWVNYEGMCLGPQLDDGSSVLVLVSDGGNCTERLMTMKLTGIDVTTWKFDAPEGGTSSFVGYPYRFVKGAKIDVALDGVLHDSVYTNNAEVCTGAVWGVTGTAVPASGDGTPASFTVGGDGRFFWGLPTSVAETPIDSSDTFEEYEAGADVSQGAVTGWTGAGEVVLRAYDPPDPPGFSMPRAAHAKVLDVDDEVVRTFSCSTNGNDTVDLMLSVTRRTEDDSYAPPDDALVAIMCGEDGKMRILCRNADGERVWAVLSDDVYATGQWIRLQIAFDGKTDPDETYAHVRIDGRAQSSADGVRSPSSPSSAGGPWFRTASATPSRRISQLIVHGSSGIDDVIKTTEDWSAEYSAATSALDGVPLEWLDAVGLGREPDVALSVENLRALGYTLADAYDAGLDPFENEPFRITAIEILDDGRLRLAFNGVREDLTDAERDANYPVYRSETPDGSGAAPVPGTTEIAEDGSGTVWISTAPVSADKGFYTIKVSPVR